MDTMNNVIMNNFSLFIPQGEIVSLVGDVKEVGDVVLAMLCGLCDNFKGCISQFGRPVSATTLSRNVSICPADFFLLEGTSVSTNVKLFLSVCRVSGK